jgi:uncharacterized protein YcnI
MSTYPEATTLVLAAALIAGPAAAHVTLDRSEMPADSYLRVALRVSHGCQGAATTGIRVQVPPELRGVRPMPHAGWTLTTVPGPAPAAGSHDAAPMPREISWQGGNLPDAHYDEFVLYIRTPAEPGATLYFPVVQDCEGGKVTRWIERPTQPGQRLTTPAYAVRIVPKGG